MSLYYSRCLLQFAIGFHDRTLDVSNPGRPWWSATSWVYVAVPCWVLCPALERFGCLLRPVMDLNLQLQKKLSEGTSMEYDGIFDIDIVEQ